MNNTTQISPPESSPSLAANGSDPGQSGVPGMKWHKFIIYFSLFVSALVNFSAGIQCVAGQQYGEDTELIYFLYDGLKALDFIYGLLLFGLAGYILFTRHQLARMKRSGPKLMEILCVLIVVLPLVYLCLVTIITGINVFDFSAVTNLLSSLVMSVINIIYYRKRRHLFVNF